MSEIISTPQYLVNLTGMLEQGNDPGRICMMHSRRAGKSYFANTVRDAALSSREVNLITGGIDSALMHSLDEAIQREMASFIGVHSSTLVGELVNPEGEDLSYQHLMNAQRLMTIRDERKDIYDKEFSEHHYFSFHKRRKVRPNGRVYYENY